MSDEKQWAVLELFGHQRIAGEISEHNLGGTFVRVDVPAVAGRPKFTKLYGQGAIYGITFCDADVALAAAEKLAVVPISTYDLASVTTEAVRDRMQRSLSYSRSAYDDDDDLPI